LFDLNAPRACADTFRVLSAVDSSSTSYQVGQFVGLAFVLVLALAVLRKARTTGFGGRVGGPLNAVVAVAAVVAAAGYLAYAAGAGMFSSSGSASPWSSQEGINMKAGFLAGCGQSIRGRTQICECVFARLTSAPPYNTPIGFETELLPAVRRFAQTRQVSSLPPAYVSAAYSCTAAAKA